MPGVITTCSKCGSQFQWNTDFMEMPDCPNCGFNPKRKFQQSDVSGLIKMLKSFDRYESTNAAAELGKLGDRRAVEPLIAALKRKRTKLTAAIALGRIPDERAVEPLIELLNDSEGPCGSAAESLIKIGTDRAVKAVMLKIETLDERDEIYDVFKAMVEKGTKFYEILISALKDDHDEVRRYAAWALGEIKDKRATEHLLPLLNDNGYQVAQNTAEALTKLGWKPTDVKEELNLYFMGKEWVNFEEFGLTAVDFLVEKLMGHEQWKVKESAANRLDKLQWEPGSEGEKAVYLIGLGRFDELSFTNSENLDVLFSALQDETYSHQFGIFDLIGRLGDSRAIGPLVSALKSEGAYVSKSAAEALGKIGDQAALEPVMQLLQSKKEHVRIAAIYALGRLGGLAARNALIALAENSNEDNKIRAAAADEIEKRTGKRPLVPKTIIQNKSRCFIATACYGYDGHKNVIRLRRFRDEQLLKTWPGKVFVSLYYRLSPSVANLIRSRPFMKKVVLFLLINPVLKYIVAPLEDSGKK